MDYLTSDIRIYFRRIISALKVGVKLGFLFAIVMVFVLLKLTNSTIVKKASSPKITTAQPLPAIVMEKITVGETVQTRMKERALILNHKLKEYPINLEQHLSRHQQKRLDILKTSFLTNNRNLSVQYILTVSGGDDEILVAYAQWLKRNNADRMLLASSSGKY